MSEKKLDFNIKLMKKYGKLLQEEISSSFAEKEKLEKEFGLTDEQFYYDFFAKKAFDNNDLAKLELLIQKKLTETKNLEYFKLLSHSALSINNKKHHYPTRVYGCVFKNKEDLKKYLNILDLRRANDHRAINKKLELFMFNKNLGQGFPVWLDSGQKIKNEIKKYIQEINKKYNMHEVSTPIFGDKKLYETSGHWQHYKEYMFKPLKTDGENLILRPMMCPHHILIFSSKQHSYKDLPIRIAEHGLLFRYEKSGALTGLERVRAMELPDGHIFLTEKQIESEVKNLYMQIMDVLKKFKIKLSYISLSINDDKGKYYVNKNDWVNSIKTLKNVLNSLKVKYVVKKGEAAFYGPKIDFQIKTSIGHDVTLSTIQLDYFLPKKFNIYYFDKNHKKQTPVLIHRGLIGTYERFVSILLEQSKGNLDFWLAPNQIVIIAISKEQNAYAKSLYEKISQKGYRVFLDDRNEMIGKKIKEAYNKKFKYQIFVGRNEFKNKNISFKRYGEKKQITTTLEKFLEEIKSKK